MFRKVKYVLFLVAILDKMNMSFNLERKNKMYLFLVKPTSSVLKITINSF